MFRMRNLNRIGLAAAFLAGALGYAYFSRQDSDSYSRGKKEDVVMRSLNREETMLERESENAIEFERKSKKNGKIFFEKVSNLSLDSAIVDRIYDTFVGCSKRHDYTDFLAEIGRAGGLIGDRVKEGNLDGFLLDIDYMLKHAELDSDSAWDVDIKRSEFEHYNERLRKLLNSYPDRIFLTLIRRFSNRFGFNLDERQRDVVTKRLGDLKSGLESEPSFFQLEQLVAGYDVLNRNEEIGEFVRLYFDGAFMREIERYKGGEVEIEELEKKLSNFRFYLDEQTFEEKPRRENYNLQKRKLDMLKIQRGVFGEE